MRRTMTINRRRDAVPFAGAGGIIVNPAARHKSLVNIQARVNDSLAAIRHIFFQMRCGGTRRRLLPLIRVMLIKSCTLARTQV